MSHILQFALALVVVAILALAICKDRKASVFDLLFNCWL